MTFTRREGKPKTTLALLEESDNNFSGTGG